MSTYSQLLMRLLDAVLRFMEWIGIASEIEQPDDDCEDNEEYAGIVIGAFAVMLLAGITALLTVLIPLLVVLT